MTGASSDDEEETGVFSRWGRKLANYFGKQKDAPTPAAAELVIKSTTEIEAATSQKIAWLGREREMLGTMDPKNLVSWPDKLIDAFYVVGLPPDTELTTIAYDLLGQERLAKDGHPPASSRVTSTSTPHQAPQATAGPSQPALHITHTFTPSSVSGTATTAQTPHLTTQPPTAPVVAYPNGPGPPTSISTGGIDIPNFPLTISTTSPEPISHSHPGGISHLSNNDMELLNLMGTSPASNETLNRIDGSILHRTSRPITQTHDKAPQPSYPASVVFRYPPDHTPSLHDDEVAQLCFPNQVAPRRLRRSPSWSSLYGVINHRANIMLGTAFIFMVKKPDALPLYGVCYVVEEPLHRPPALAQSVWPACSSPYRQCLITAPRCYCITSHYPFFTLLTQALNGVVSLERLNRSLAFNLELQSDRSLHHGLSSSLTGAATPSSNATPPQPQPQPQTATSQVGSSATPAGTSTAALQSHSQQDSDPDDEENRHQQQASSSAVQLVDSRGRSEGLMPAATFALDVPTLDTTTTTNNNNNNTTTDVTNTTNNIDTINTTTNINTTINTIATITTINTIHTQRSKEVSKLSDQPRADSLQPPLPQPMSDTGLWPPSTDAPAGASPSTSLPTPKSLSSSISAPGVRPPGAGLPTPPRPLVTTTLTDTPGRVSSAVVDSVPSGGSSTSTPHAHNTDTLTRHVSLSSFHTAADTEGGGDVDEVVGPARALSREVSYSSFSPGRNGTPPNVLGGTSRVGSLGGTRMPAGHKRSWSRDMRVDSGRAGETAAVGADAGRAGESREGSPRGDSVGSCGLLEEQEGRPVASIGMQDVGGERYGSSSGSIVRPQVRTPERSPLSAPSLPMSPQTPAAIASPPVLQQQQQQSDEIRSEGVSGQDAGGDRGAGGAGTGGAGMPSQGLGQQQQQQQGGSSSGLSAAEIAGGPGLGVGRNISGDGGVVVGNDRWSGGSAGGGRRLTSDLLLSNQFSPLAVLDALASADIPTPGDVLQVPLRGLPPLNHTRWVLPRRWPVLAPVSSLMAYGEDELSAELSPWACAILARTLSLPALVTLISAALLERPIVFFHPDPALLTCCVLGLLPMLRPFTWQYVVLPMMPSNSLAILDSPVPFLVGCQYKTPEVSSRCTTLIRVNLYKGSVSNAASLPPLPGMRRLLACLAPHYDRIRASEAAFMGPRPLDKWGTAPHSVPEEQIHAAAAMLWEVYVHLIGMPTVPPPSASTSVTQDLATTNVDFGSALSDVAFTAEPTDRGMSEPGPRPTQSGTDNTGGHTSATSRMAGSQTASAPGVAPNASSGGHQATSSRHSSTAGAWGAAPLWQGVVGELRPHTITHVGANGTRTATLLKESLMEVQAPKDRPWVRAFTETTMFQIYTDQVMAAFCEGRRWD